MKSFSLWAIVFYNVGVRIGMNESGVEGGSGIDKRPVFNSFSNPLSMYI